MADVTAEGFMKVSIGGKALSPGMARHLTSVTFKESIDKLDSADVTIAVPEGSDHTQRCPVISSRETTSVANCHEHET